MLAFTKISMTNGKSKKSTLEDRDCDVGAASRSCKSLVDSCLTITFILDGGEEE